MNTKEQILDRVLNQKIVKTMDKEKALSDVEIYIVKHYTKIINKCNQLIDIIEKNYKPLELDLKIKNDELDEVIEERTKLKDKLNIVKNIHYKSNRFLKIDEIIKNFIPIELNQTNEKNIKYIINDFGERYSEYIYQTIIEKTLSENTDPSVYNFLFKNLKFNMNNLNSEKLLKILPHIEYFKIKNDIDIYKYPTIIDDILNSETDDTYKQNLLYKIILLNPKMFAEMEKNSKFRTFYKNTIVDDMSFLIYSNYSNIFINMYVNNKNYKKEFYINLLTYEPLLILLNKNINCRQFSNIYLENIQHNLNKNYNLNKTIKVLELSSVNHFCNLENKFFMNFFSEINKLYLEKNSAIDKRTFKCFGNKPIDYTNYSSSDSSSESDSDDDYDYDDDDSNDDSDYDF